MVKSNSRLRLAICVLLFISACGSPQAQSSVSSPEPRIFAADGIDNPRIQFIWLELPQSIEPGQAEVRLFIAQIEPPEPILPSPNELRCELKPEDEPAILGPESVPFEFTSEGTFSGSYTFRACPECIECYINWDTILEITGVISAEGVNLEIAIKHLGHNVPGSFVSAELEPTLNPSQVPIIVCNHTLECQEIVFVNR